MSALNPLEGLSPRQRTVALVGGGVAVVGVVVYMRRRKAAAAASPAADASGATNPADSTSGDGPAPATPDTTGGYGGLYTTSGSNGGGATTSTPEILTNEAWSQAVQAGLTSIGYDPVEVSKALGDWFGHRPLDAAETQVVEAAEAEYGAPPGGAPPVLSAPPPPPPPPVPHSVRVPHVLGMSVDAAEKAVRAAGLVPRVNITGHGTLVIVSQYPEAGLKVESGTDVDMHAAVKPGRKPPEGVPVRRKPPVERPQ